MRFSGKVAAVTGGAGGLGIAIAAGLAAEGASVAILDLEADAAAAAAVAVGKGAVPIACDVASAESVAAAMARLERDLGGLDVLVCAAGGSLYTPRDLPDIAPEDFDLVVDVNLKGTFLCCQQAVPLMVRRNGGAIVTVSSIGGRTASPVTGVSYAAAKAGVLGLTRRLAREIGPLGIRVNAVAPGFFPSGPRLQELWETMPDSAQEEVLQSIPLRRMPRTDEAVGPILFLASEEASYITGAVLDVNGGRFMTG